MSQNSNGVSSRISTPIALGVLAFASLCVVLVAALVFRGLDPSSVVQFVGGLIPTTVGVIALSSQNRKTQDAVVHTTEVVEHTAEIAAHNNEALQDVQSQVNGKLDARFAELSQSVNEVHQRLDTSGVPPVQSAP